VYSPWLSPSPPTASHPVPSNPQYPNFRPTIIRKIIDNLDEVTSADALRVALWILGEYSDAADTSSGENMISDAFEAIRALLGDPPFLTSKEVRFYPSSVGVCDFCFVFFVPFPDLLFLWVVWCVVLGRWRRRRPRSKCPRRLCRRRTSCWRTAPTPP
jgi:hypothetical protein